MKSSSDDSNSKKNIVSNYESDVSAHQKVESIWKQVESQRNENLKRQRQLDEERTKMTSYLDKREKELASQLERIRSDLADREVELERHFRRQYEALKSENEQKAQRLEAIGEESRQKNIEIQNREKALEEEIKKFKEEKLRYDEENNKKLQSISDEYVSEVIEDLKSRSGNLSKVSFWWSVFGGASIFLGMIFAAVSVFQTSTGLESNTSLPALTFLTIKGAVFIIISGLASRYAFILSRRYLNESLRFSDIAHNLSFGRLYVQSYGSTAGWDQVKDAFSKWNHSDNTPSPTLLGENREDEKSEISLDIPQVTQLLNAIKSLKS